MPIYIIDCQNEEEGYDYGAIVKAETPEQATEFWKEHQVEGCLYYSKEDLPEHTILVLPDLKEADDGIISAYRL